VPNGSHRWSFSFIGPLEESLNLSVLAALANRWTEVGIHLSEMSKSEAQAMTFCEIAFTAPHSLVEELLLSPDVSFGWNLKLCGWLLDLRQQPNLLLEFKRDHKGLFLIPITEIDVAFAASDDWDRIEFFSTSKNKLLEIREFARA